MTKIQFAEKVAEQVNGQVKEIEKANGVIMTGILIPKGAVSPTLYIDNFYDHNDLDGAIAAVKEVEAKETPSIDITGIVTQYSTARKYIKPRLFNKATNYDPFISADDYGFDDLIIVPYMEDVVENGSIRVTKEMLEQWDITAEEVIKDAMENVDEGEYGILPMIQVLMGYGIEFPDDVPTDDPLYVITNKKKVFGAAGVLFLKDKLKEMFPQGYYVLPSSVHEVLVIPADKAEQSMLSEMVRSVNATEVADEEVLGSRAYRFF